MFASTGFLLVLLATSPAPPQEDASAQPRIGLEALLRQMVDLEALGQLPDPPYTCRQFSSYDPASKSPTENWFANGDCGHFLRVEEIAGRRERVMMDAAGPGCVVRIWSANPKGTLRFYVDGASQPALAEKMTDLLGGRSDCFPAPLACERSRGWNLYFPIPYQQHLKITCDEGGFYYHVNYRTYPPGVKIDSFSRAALRRARPLIDRIARTLDVADPGPTATLPSTRVNFSLSIPAGERRAVFALNDGPAAIEQIRIATAQLDTAALRAILLHMSFDGETTVEVPLGDFFGAAPGKNPYQSLVSGVDTDGVMWSRWFMPFGMSCEVALQNSSERDQLVSGAIFHKSARWDDLSLHFHAGWRIERNLHTRPFRDWRCLEVDGSGIFVGESFNIANPVKNWWGEGDEKIYVDRETFPSHFGTGTEDYFGYAWCCPELFTHAYHNQPRCDGPGNYGFTSVNRWHILDNIPFGEHFRFDLEIWHWKVCDVTVSSTAYWYARPGARAAFAPISAADLIPPALPPYKIYQVPGALEAEGFQILAKTGNVRPQTYLDKWSHESQLWWTDAKPGDVLELGFQVAKAGRYRVFGRFTTAVDYGIVALSIEGKEALSKIDLYHDGVVPTGEIDLGVHTLKQGRNRLLVRILGANPKAQKKYMFGLDYLRLQTP